VSNVQAIYLGNETITVMLQELSYGSKPEARTKRLPFLQALEPLKER
jgi:hypothetical protein